MLRAGRKAVSQASIVKLGVDELLALTGSRPVEDAVRSLWHSQMKVMAVTNGSKGAEIYTSDGKLICKGYAVNAVDTTGAGDAFMASLMSGLLQSGLDAGADQMLGILRASCAAGALATTRKGAMESMPKAEEIAQLLATQPENQV